MHMMKQLSFFLFYFCLIVVLHVTNTLFKSLHKMKQRNQCYIILILKAKAEGYPLFFTRAVYHMMTFRAVTSTSSTRSLTTAVEIKVS